MIHCNVCNAGLTHEIFNSGTQKSLTSLCEERPGPTRVLVCPACGHLQTPPLDDVSEYYESTYKILIESEEEDQIYDVVDGKPLYRTQHQVATLERKIKIPTNAAVLDYGSAKGATLRELSRRKTDIVPHVFDVSDMYLPFWHRFVTPECCATHELKQGWQGRFDLVTSFFALEHIDKLADAISRISWLLKDDGIFYGIVPNVFTNVADFIVVDHVNHFTESSLRNMLASGGLDTIDIDAVSHRGAFIMIARKSSSMSGHSTYSSGAQAELTRAAEIATYWRELADRIRAFERQHEFGPAAVYGAGFYGAFIATTLSQPEQLRFFLDQNRFLQGRSFFGKPVLPPASLPEDMSTVFVGLNPAHARKSLAEVDAFRTRKIDFFFL